MKNTFSIHLLFSLILLIVLPLFTVIADPPLFSISTENLSMHVYPNPATSYLKVRIAADNFQVLTLSLEDTKRKVLLTDRITQPGVHTINLRLLSQGSYVLHVQSKDGRIDQRTPVQKVAH